ncbi:MAG TPA: metal transporter [Aurantimonas coralicida]|uniref:Metal transporter n=2 Tax=root TaxID=1 RepID=A0A9C9NH74_9HYPH|nr:metal transporter [Aurantimonas coralicida]HEU01285.1 metal transporter [Aurantimonas coralicida]
MTRTILRIALPLVLILAVAAAFLASDPFRYLNGGTPPTEELTVERTVLDSDGIALHVRAGGSEPMTIAQLQVDGAYWTFTQEPAGALERMSDAWLRIPYAWVQGETHHVTLLTSAGVTFDHTIDVAIATPVATAGMLGAFGLIGLFVGVVPVALGMLFYPALRSGGRRTFQFALALTIGLLAFLLIDTLEEALELASESAPGFHAGVLVWLVAALTFAVLMIVGRRKGGTLEGVRLATAIALGIGLHNFGEGLAIGSAFATGAAALGSFLVLGFTLHNLTEGIGIVAPMTKKRPSLWVFVALAALAGLPAVAGIWIGSYAFSPHWAALAFAVGAGAILQVIVEVGALLIRQARAEGQPWLSATALSGIGVGAVAMYATALLVQV